MLGRKLLNRQCRAGIEVSNSVQVHVVDLAVPARHRKDRGLGPHLLPECGDDESDFLAKLTLERVQSRLARLDSATRIGPEPSDRSAGPLESNKQGRVVLIKDQRPHTLPKPHELKLSHLGDGVPATPGIAAPGACTAGDGSRVTFAGVLVTETQTSISLTATGH